VDDPDIVFIGAGINSLVAAAMLSATGQRVLVLERSDRPGGCMRTDELTLPGFHHDVMAATFVLFLTSPAYGALGADLARHGFALCHTDHPTAVLRPDGSALVLGMDREANRATMNARASGDGDAHVRDVAATEADAPFLFALLGGPLWSWSTARLLAGQAWRRGLAGWGGRALTPARAWLGSTYKSADVQALWAPWVLHVGLTPESTCSAQMGKVIAFALEAAGAPVVRGGAGQAAAAFHALIRERGGEVCCNTEVDRVMVENGKAVGVVTVHGKQITARRVVASVAPGQLYCRLLPGGAGAEQRQEAHDYRHGRGNFQLHYALDSVPDWRAEGIQDVALIHLSDGIDSVSKSANEAERGMLPQTPTICVGQPHRLDPSRCPEGKAILWLQISDAPGVIKGDAAGEIETGPDWDEPTREAFADRIEAILARHIRDFSKIKLARRAYSPADLAALNPNLVGGDPYGGACSIDQFFIWRPFANSVNDVTGIRNLHHIGASTHPGPGLGGGSGYNLAKRLGA
jgi:phytoene dehydrogenase-like protein